MIVHAGSLPLTVF